MKAFPCHPDMKNPDFDGMDLRDYFAAEAMQGMLANGSMSVELDSLLVQRAYQIADFMLEERQP